MNNHPLSLSNNPKKNHCAYTASFFNDSNEPLYLHTHILDALMYYIRHMLGIKKSHLLVSIPTHRLYYIHAINQKACFTHADHPCFVLDKHLAA